MFQIIFKLSVAAVAASLLSGCGSSGPSESDINQAMARWGSEMGGAEGAKQMKEMYGGMKLVSCAKSDENGWRCDLTNPSMSGRFVKSDSGWVFMGK
jgi:major membrane immunogen (membrane-anchored lipoprotein)